MGLDSPWSLLRQEVETVAFKAHPYRNPIIGWLEDLEQMQPDDLRYHYDRYYRPNNAALVLAGDLDGADALRRVNSLFGHLKFQQVPPDHVPKEPDQIGERRVMVRRPSNLPRVLMVYHAPEIGHADFYPLQVLRRVLGQGKTSRLYRRLVEKEKLASSVTAEYEETQDPGLFYLRAEVKPGSDPARVEKALTEEVERLADEAVREAELRKARNQAESQFVFAQESALDWASLLGFSEGLCQPEYLDTYLDRVRAVSARDLRRVARKYLFTDNRTVGWMLDPNSDRE
jgi:zinc protease